MSDRKIYYKNENILLMCFPVEIKSIHEMETFNTWNWDI